MEKPMEELPSPLDEVDDGDIKEEDDEDASDCENETWEDWDLDGDSDSLAEGEGIRCLFCISEFSGRAAPDMLFEHCRGSHAFDFLSVVKEFELDIYGAIRLVNFIRSKVAENEAWSWKQCHDGMNREWEDDLFLRPYLANDPLLHSLPIDDDEEEEITGSMQCEELLANSGCPTNHGETFPSLNEERVCIGNAVQGTNVTANGMSKTQPLNGCEKGDHSGDKLCKRTNRDECASSFNISNDEMDLKAARAAVAAKEIKIIDDGYFGSYSSFRIHRTMLSDKPRMEAYRDALLSNPTLMNGATVMDVGCGTGILSLLAAQGGASKVVAVEASSKMAALATQIAEKNGLLADTEASGKPKKGSTGVITVVNTMIESLGDKLEIPFGGFDVIVSEWMGYCLLYESMLSSVLYARDHFLKPGGVILPDTAAIYGAGFGRGGTSFVFWENVYGFDMSCIGNEVNEEALSTPIVDIINSEDIVTEPSVLHTFDLACMKPSEMDFTASFELKAKKSLVAPDGSSSQDITWCYGIVLWFETGFTSRFCKEKPTVLSTSPFTAETHWSQTLFTLREPIAMAGEPFVGSSSPTVGTEACPAAVLQSRISIARASAHRSIDVSIEVSGISHDNRKRTWPVQIFNLS